MNLLNINLHDTLTSLLLLIPALTIHELAHGLAAYWLGDQTAKRDGRISLNPLKHIDPMGILFIILTGFGWAKPVMTDPRYFKNPKKGMALTALAGPVANFILALITALIIVPLAASGSINGNSILFIFLLQFFYMNLSLGVFNLLPIPPLDGSKVLSVFLEDQAYWRFISYPNGFIILLLLSFTGATAYVMRPIIGFLSNGIFYLVNLLYHLH